MKTIAELALECGVHRTTLNKWAKQLLEQGSTTVRMSGHVLIVDEESPEFKEWLAGAKLGRPRERDLHMTTTHYTRSIDDGAGRQNVTVVDGVITRQELVARQGYYTGDGNPELIGKEKRAMYGMGFRKVAGPQSWNSMASKWQSVNRDYEIFDDVD